MSVKIFEITNVKRHLSDADTKLATDPDAYYAILLKQLTLVAQGSQANASESLPYHFLQDIMHYYGVNDCTALIGKKFASSESDISKCFKNFLGFVIRYRTMRPPDKRVIFAEVAQMITLGQVPVLYPIFPAQATYAVFEPIVNDKNNKDIERDLLPELAKVSWARIRIKNISSNSFDVVGRVTMSLMFDETGVFTKK